MEKILKKIGQLQYEISCLELDKETLTGVTIRTDELKELVKNCSIHDVVGQSEQLSCGRNITTCVFYKDGGKCSNLEYCRDQTT